MKPRDIAYIGILAALIAVCSWITIPTVVPFTLQTFAIFLSTGVLGGRRGTLAVAVYLLLGAVGLPVFSGFQGGLGRLLGTTGGYLVGFLLTALVMWGAERWLGRRTPVFLISALAGLALCYLFGTLWYLALYTAGGGTVAVMTVLWTCVLPFIPLDLAKLALALILSRRLAAALGLAQKTGTAPV